MDEHLLSYFLVLENVTGSVYISREYFLEQEKRE